METHIVTLSTSENENIELVIDSSNKVEGFGNYDFCLVGRFLIDRLLNFQAMQNTMATLWRPSKAICIQEMQLNLYLFRLFHNIDLDQVLEGSPGTFNNHLLVY